VGYTVESFLKVDKIHPSCILLSRKDCHLCTAIRRGVDVQRPDLKPNCLSDRKHMV